MNIAVDITSIIDQNSKKDVGFYAINITKSLVRNLDHEWHLLGFCNEEVNFKYLQIENAPNIFFHSLGGIKTPNVFSNHFIWKQISSALLSIKPDVFVSLNIERDLPKFEGEKFVFLHDTTLLKTNFSQNIHSLIRIAKSCFWKRKLLKVLRTANIIVDSETSRKSLLNLSQKSTNKIFAVHPGISDKYKKNPLTSEHKINAILKTLKIRTRFLLYYSVIEKESNIEKLVTSFKNVIKVDPNLQLLIASKDYKLKVSGEILPKTHSAKRLLEQIQKSNLEGRIVLSEEIPEEYMPSIIRKAELVINNLINEKLNYSVIDTLAIGTPILIPNIPINQEFFSGFATFFTPNNQNEISRKVLNIVNNNILSEDFIERGKKYATSFSWEKTSNKLISLFEANKLNVYKRNTIIKSIPSASSNKVLLICPDFIPNTNNYSKYIQNLIKVLKLNDAMFEISVPINRQNNLPPQLFKKIAINYFPNITNFKSFSFNIPLLKNILFSKSTIFHNQTMGNLWIDFLMILKKFLSRKRKQYIVTPNDFFIPSKKQRFDKRFLSWLYVTVQRLYLNWIYDYFIVVTRSQTASLKSIYKIESDKIKYIPTSIDISSIQLAENLEVKKKYKLEDMLVVSTIIDNNIQEFNIVIDVIKVLEKEYDNLKYLFLISNVDDIVNYKKIIIEARCESNVILIHNPSNNLKAQILDISEICILTTKEDIYGFNIIEAMAYKNSLIVPETLVSRDLILDKVNGFTYQTGNGESLYKRINRLLIDKTLRDSIKENNLRFSQKFFPKEAGKEYQILYSKS